MCWFSGNQQGTLEVKNTGKAFLNVGAADLMCIPHAIWIHNGNEKVLVKILRAEPRKSSESRSVLKAFQSIGTKVIKRDGIEQPLLYRCTSEQNHQKSKQKISSIFKASERFRQQ